MKYILGILIASFIISLWFAYQAQAIPVVQIGMGGTGTSTVPSAGQILIGDGTRYVFVASSTIVSANGVASTRTINTLSPLSGGGDLSANRTLSVATATASQDGILTSADWTTFNNSIDSLANISSTNITNTGYITNSGILTQRGILNATGTIPTVSSCGDTPSISGTNLAGTITVGSGITTACTLNFATPTFFNAPACLMTINTSAVTGGVTSISSSSATFSFSATVGDGKIYYHCIGND